MLLLVLVEFESMKRVTGTLPFELKSLGYREPMLGCRQKKGKPLVCWIATRGRFDGRSLRKGLGGECPFSPYFSPHEPQKFACVHKIFGASNVSKMLMEVPESQRADAASSLVYEANARIRDPVYGCMGAISALQQQAQALQAELDAVRQEIMRYRCHENAVAAVMVAGYQPNNVNDRMTVGSGINLSSQQHCASPDYNVASPSRVATPDTKERYWASIN
ncbi:hypothetical protein R1flu_025490 [Riccia fluitans]|uniref:LOB domain-containing protein n=1 Tax=Riccia fluitans TaxID=41844 RepID=A0ABD1Y225_9MARC